MLNKNFAVIVFLYLYSIGISAQINGVICSDSTHEPVSYAYIIAYDGEDKFLEGAISDERGIFSFSYLQNVKKLSISCTGYEKQDTCSTAFFNGDIGTITLKIDVHNLDEVSVSASMKEREASKETIFITDSLRNGVTNAIQLLAKITGVTTDWGTDEIKVGKDRDVPVIINGKRASKDYAININPNRIRKVEILRHPSGKYSDFPIVMNLVLYSNYLGLDVSVFSRDMYSLKNKHSNNESAGANVSYSHHKMNVYGSISLLHRQIYEVSGYEYKSGNGSTVQTDDIEYKCPNISKKNNSGEITIGADYKFTENHVISLQGWTEHKKVKCLDTFNVWHDGNVQQQTNINDYNTTDYTLGLFYNGKFANKLYVSSELVYNGYKLREERNFMSNNQCAINLYDGGKNYWRYYLSADYRLNDKWTFTIDFTQITKDYSTLNRENGELMYKNSEMRSKMMAALFYKPLHNLNFNVGSHIFIVKDKDEARTTTTSHTSWMPLFKGYWKPAEWIDYLINYYCDVEYPNLDQLSNVEWQVNNILWHRGNSALRPRIMNYCDFALNFINVVKINYIFKKSSNEIIDFYMNDGGKTYKTLGNCNFVHNYIGLEGDYNIGKSVRLSFVANYQWYQRYLDEAKHHGKTWYLDTNVQCNIPHSKWNLMAEYFLRYDIYPLLQGKQYNEEEDFVFAVSYPLFKNKLPIALSLKLPTELLSKRIYAIVDIPNFHYRVTGDNRVNAFCIMLNIKYNINKGKTSKNKNNKNVDSEK